MTHGAALLGGLVAVCRGPGSRVTRLPGQRRALLPLQDGRGAGAPAGGRGGVLPGGSRGGGGGGPQGPFGGQRGAAAGDAVGHRLVHPQHLWVAGGVRAEGALVPGEAPAVRGRGGRAPVALGSHAQVQRHRAGVQWGRLGRALVPGGASREVWVGGRAEQKGALQLGG